MNLDKAIAAIEAYTENRELVMNGEIKYRDTTAQPSIGELEVYSRTKRDAVRGMKHDDDTAWAFWDGFHSAISVITGERTLSQVEHEL